MTSIAQDSSQMLGSCTFMNMSGDITIVWDEHNREQVLAVIRKKMEEGYTFFTTQSFLFHKLSRRVKVTKRNLNSIDQLTITDEQFEKMVAGMNDSDVAQLVRSEKAELVKRKDKSEVSALSRANKAEDVIDKNSVAVRPIAGG